MAYASVAADTCLVLDKRVNDVPKALQVPTKAVSPCFQVLLSLANTVIWLSILPTGQILLPTQIAALTTTATFSNLAIVTSVGILAALLTNPIARTLSDQTTSRLRRRPWLIAGTVLPAATLVLLANASSFLTLVFWWAIFHVAANALLAALSVVVPDQVPVRQSATVSVFVSLSLPLGAVVSALLVSKVVKSTVVSSCTCSFSPNNTIECCQTM